MGVTISKNRTKDFVRALEKRDINKKRIKDYFEKKKKPSRKFTFFSEGKKPSVKIRGF